MTRALLALAASAALICSACENLAQPEEPIWNKQACAHCRMLLSEPRFAAQLTTADGRRLFFDDVGCLAAFLHDERPALGHAWVRNGARWSDAEHTRYGAVSSTPMGFGFAPSATGQLDFAAVKSAVTEQRARGAAHGEAP